MEPNKAKVLQTATDMEAYISGWKNAFRECDDLEERWLAHSRQSVKDMLVAVGATLDDLKNVVPTVTFNERIHAPS